MTADYDATRARRYLLRQAGEGERETLERDYFADDQVLEQVAAVEDDLIEEYLAGELAPGERERFEKVYLSAPQRRRRVETMRRLMASSVAAGQSKAPSGAPVVSGRPARWSWPLQWAVAAAAVIVLGVGLAWMLRPAAPDLDDSRAGLPADARSADPGASPAQDSDLPAPRVVAVTLSPFAVRGASRPGTLVLADEADAIVLNLQGDGGLASARARVATVAGDEIWQGPATTGEELAPGVVARVEMPASALTPDDYIVTLYGTGAGAAEREQQRYFLRVRAR